MYNKILVPILLETENPEPPLALEVAQTLRKSGGMITLFNVVEELPSYASSYVPDEFAERTRGQIKEQLARLASEITDVETAVVRGHPASAILDWAREYGSDCIVIASHKPGLQDFFLGSTAARVVRHAQCAVHVMR